MKTIAFYLPQYHQTPENDKWWGEGFTEWTNMKKAKSLFPGHYQPRVPLNSNYYDLSELKNIRRQAEMAKKYGIYGFCLYHYWFNGKLLLEKPVHLLRDNKDIDINYCLSWANENWTNGWVSDRAEILIEHDFNDRNDWKNHIDYFLTFFSDDRYIKVDGKPVLIIYYPNLITQLMEMLDFWNKEAIKAGFKGVSFIFQHPYFYFDSKTDKSLFDYGIEFEPAFSCHNCYGENANIQNLKIKLSYFLQKRLHLYIHLKQRKLVKFDYDILWNDIISREPDRHMFPCAFVDWDNTPRKGERGSLVMGASPEKFEEYFKKLLRKTRQEYGTDMLFIFAWNEWAEGGYLEPDEKYGCAYLEAIYRALKEENELPYKE